MLTFIDTHAHLNSKQFDADLPKVITSSKKAGIKKIIVPGFDLATSTKSMVIARQYKNYCFGTCGIHPYHANKVYDLFETRGEMVKIIEENKNFVAAIGEVGLDYHLYGKEDAAGKKNQQKELLKIEIELALKYEFPMILHCRNAWEDYAEILSEYKNDNLSGVSHCFEGGRLYLDKIVSLGLFIGVNGLTTFSSKVKDTIEFIPLERMLLETDAPFLTPEPYRGKRNTPKNIRLVAKFVAGIQNTTVEEVSKKTSENALGLFNMLK